MNAALAFGLIQYTQLVNTEPFHGLQARVFFQVDLSSKSLQLRGYCSTQLVFLNKYPVVEFQVHCESQLVHPLL
ncbi:MAG: hypothetical protein Q8S84_01440 [bacterium]|nr:hypothetical protein [bacterium]